MCCFNLITVTYYFGSVTPRPGTEILTRWLSARDDTCVSSLHSQFFSFSLLQRFHFLLFYTLTYCLSPSLSLSITISPLLVPNAYIPTQDLLCSSTYIWPSKCVVSQQRKWKKVLFKDFANRFFSAFIYAVFCQGWLPVSLPLEAETTNIALRPYQWWKYGRVDPICIISCVSPLFSPVLLLSV